MTIAITRLGKHRLKKPLKGCKRQWVCCKHCSWVGYYDYVPYSLSNPIMTLGCSHLWEHSAKRIKAEQVPDAYHQWCLNQKTKETA